MSANLYAMKNASRGKKSNNSCIEYQERRASGRVDVSAFTFAGDRIKAIYTVSNPDKLGRLVQAGVAQLARDET